MLLNLHQPTTLSPSQPEWFNPIDVIEMMVERLFQLAELEHHIQTLQPTFFAACLALNTDKITLQKAIITRRLTPAQWDYSAAILQQQDVLKHLKQQFQHTHQPISGRDITWVLKRLLTTL